MAILVVDDSPDARAVVQEILGAAGYAELEVAGSAEEAFDILGLDGAPPMSEARAAELELVLLDVVMPGLDGLEACRRIKAALPNLPVILMTACAETADIDAAYRAGANDYIRKPLQPMELVARVAMAQRLKQETDRRLDLVHTLERLSSLDALTGLANRRELGDTLEREWRRAVRGRTPLAAIMLDIDFFKAFNDRYGHQQGDEALRRVAAVLAAAVTRPADLAARYGGEEFLALLPDTPLEGAAAVAERVRAGVAALDLPHARSRVAPHVTVSLGATSIVPDVVTPIGLLMAAADEAMYRAKRGGRNRVHILDPGAKPQPTRGGAWRARS